MTEPVRNFRDEPAYSEGFYDAADSTPLFDDADPAYKAGWQAYWSCRALLEKAGFEAKSNLEFAKTTEIAPLQSNGGER